MTSSLPDAVVRTRYLATVNLCGQDPVPKVVDDVVFARSGAGVCKISLCPRGVRVERCEREVVEVGDGRVVLEDLVVDVYRAPDRRVSYFWAWWGSPADPSSGVFGYEADEDRTGLFDADFRSLYYMVKGVHIMGRPCLELGDSPKLLARGVPSALVRGAARHLLWLHSHMAEPPRSFNHMREDVERWLSRGQLG